MENSLLNLLIASALSFIEDAISIIPLAIASSIPLRPLLRLGKSALLYLSDSEGENSSSFTTSFTVGQGNEEEIPSSLSFIFVSPNIILSCSYIGHPILLTVSASGWFCSPSYFIRIFFFCFWVQLTEKDFFTTHTYIQLDLNKIIQSD
ncbi:hypothetical protein MIMGU_mgv1a015718mg [Erythranthe guttata]|uniref:Uncharacterized protein n=1 Tax=Erythranthe guttata TaxID=4155 RepID=A0A022QT93_ERYGU|nr:hypothetical protein MIMGU_mgv1a015718mg [Erythranthe guttata]